VKNALFFFFLDRFASALWSAGLFAVSGVHKIGWKKWKEVLIGGHWKFGFPRKRRNKLTMQYIA